MSNDVELENWRQQWQGEVSPAIDSDSLEQLRRRVVRENRWVKLSLIAPILVTIGVGGAMVLRALRTHQPIDVVLAIETWIFIVVTWAGCLWLARGTWRPLADTTAAFIDVSIRRRKANLRGVILGACLYMAQLVFVVLVLGAMSPDGVVPLLTSTFTIAAFGLGMLGALGLYYWVQRRQRPVLERLAELKRQLQSD